MQIIHSAPNPLSPPPPPPPLPDAYEPPRYLQPPPWRLQLPKVDLTLATFSKQFTNSDNFRMEFILRKMHYPGATFIYTDGSKCHEKTASAYCFDDVHHGVCITDNASVFTAELYAIKLALLRLQQVRMGQVTVADAETSEDRFFAS